MTWIRKLWPEKFSKTSPNSKGTDMRIILRWFLKKCSFVAKEYAWSRHGRSSSITAGVCATTGLKESSMTDVYYIENIWTLFWQNVLTVIFYNASLAELCTHFLCLLYKLTVQLQQFHLETKVPHLFAQAHHAIGIYERKQSWSIWRYYMPWRIEKIVKNLPSE
jgi:hypothetical protein